MTTSPYTALYLYHKRGALTVATDKPEGFELSDGRRLTPGRTKDQTTAWIVEVSRRLPILPEELCQ